MAGSGQERCHPLEAFYASFAKATGRLVCWVANGSLIHTKSGCFQQRIDVLQRLGFAMPWPNRPCRLWPSWVSERSRRAPVAACCTGPQKSWVPEGAGTVMGEPPVSPTTTLCPQGKRRTGGEGGWVFSSPPQLRFSVGITRKNRVPLRPQSPAGPTPSCGQGFSGGTMRSSVWSLCQRRDCAMALHCCSSTAMRSISSLNVGTWPRSIPEVVIAA